MFEVHNKLFTTSNEQSERLQESFGHAAEHMKNVPGFHEFHMLKSSDTSHLIVRVVWQSEADYKKWIESDHFKQAHRGQGNSDLKSELLTYEIVL